MGSQLPPHLVAQILANQGQDTDPVLDARRKANEETARQLALQAQAEGQSYYPRFGLKRWGNVEETLGQGSAATPQIPPGTPEIPVTLEYGPDEVGASPQTEQQKFQAGIQAQRQAAIAQHGDPTHKPMGPPDLQAPLRVLDEAAEGMRQGRRDEAAANIGEGAVEFAPGQFYKGPERVGGTARRSSYARPGQTASLPPTSSGRGTVSSPVIRDEQGNQKEFLSARPEVARDQRLQRAQQNAAIAQAEAQEEYAKQQKGVPPGGKPVPVNDQIAGQIRDALQAAVASGQITPEQYIAALTALLETYTGDYNPSNQCR